MPYEHSAADEYYLTLLRRFVWPGLTKRQKRKILRIDPLLGAVLHGLSTNHSNGSLG